MQQLILELEADLAEAHADVAYQKDQLARIEDWNFQAEKKRNGIRAALAKARANVARTKADLKRIKEEQKKAA